MVLILDRIENFGPIPFKYNKNCDNKEDFSKIIKDSWEIEVLGSPHFVWESKLKNLRTSIKKCARENEIIKKNKKN